ncbi:hypothetical protein CC86DRAFT_28009 [Ophiobolus disseminans]|uniref:Uncharacterized protein n=1 Tax=Ophiobolus disseminans TaxID=1469910 RepID=A0A6A7A0M3_9PLEO|nr:hypothetical protein CC86DRAFT_28009 [Ophiobolus disseminans]
MRFHCRDVVETLLASGVDGTLADNYSQELVELAFAKNNLAMVKTILLNGAPVSDQVANIGQTRLKTLGYAMLKTFEGSEEEAVVAYLIAMSMKPDDIVAPKFDILKRVVEEVEESKIWSTKVALDRQDPWFLPGSKAFGQSLLSLGF